MFGVAILRQLFDSMGKLQGPRERVALCSRQGLHWNISLSRLRDNLRNDLASGTLKSQGENLNHFRNVLHRKLIRRQLVRHNLGV